MNKQQVLTLALTAIVAATATAKPRTQEQLQQAAVQAINEHRAHLRLAPRHDVPKELKRTAGYALIGYENGSYAVVATDDVAPEVLGVSETAYSAGRNTNLEWWLNAVDQVVTQAAASGTPLTTTKPDPDKFPTAVPQLLTTTWDQDTPYSNYCPKATNGYERCLTGCVATAMAQVLNYFRQPEHGIGQRTIYYPSLSETYSGQRTAVTTDFSAHYYDWDNMLDSYSYGNYTQTQADAVAQLMLDCGVAADMMYGPSSSGGSGAYSDEAAAGLRTYFGLEGATCLVREDYTEAQWMELVYNEISTNGPIYYGGADLRPWVYGGHAFVLDGYREDGKVHVNWGWSGDDNGYYDIALLNPSGYQFKDEQDMIVGIESQAIQAELVQPVVELTQAGQLVSELNDVNMEYVSELTVSGPINSTDLKALRRMAGVDSVGVSTHGRLSKLILKDARFVSGGAPYLIESGNSYTTQDDELPYKAFYGATRLRKLVLPETLNSIGDGAFGLTIIDSLGTVGSDDNAQQTYDIVDGIIYSRAEPNVIIGSLPSVAGELTIGSEVTEIHPYAFAGRNLSKVVFPESVNSIGKQAFYNCRMVETIRVENREVPTVGANAFAGIDSTYTKLYVPAGTKDTYKRAQGWKRFSNIAEFGTTVKARNANRYYGDPNPNFGYTLSGDYVTGVAELTCEADELSPVGTYDIIPSAGTITASGLTFVNGTLTVKKAPLTVSVVSVSREQWSENPEFELVFDGLKNGETEPEWISLPYISTAATAQSAVGQYAITISGGEARNYTLTLQPGILTITENTTAIRDVRSDTRTEPIFTLDGRRISGTLRPGVYIRSGKKYVVK
ncbi:MAG: C10 family peptidase [Prevotella sp.]|nr:C10 family peptidase [Prevotella sp.]